MTELSNHFFIFLQSCIIGQCLFSIFYLAAVEWQKNKWLVLFFVSILLPIIGMKLGLHQLNLLPYAFLDNPSFILISTPAFFLYAAQLVGIKVARMYRLLCFLPFMLFYTLFLFLPIPNPKTFLQTVHSFFETSSHISFLIVLFGQAFVYSLAVLRLVSINQKKYQDEFAEENIFIRLDWLKWMTICYLILSITLPILLPFFHLFADQILPYWASLLTLLAFAYALSFFAFRQPILYKTAIQSVLASEKLAQNNDSKPNPNTIETTTKRMLSEAKKKELIEQLETYFATQKPYLNKTIRMPDLANSLGVSTNVFSYLINEHYGVNFFSFINQYRVNYATELLKNEEYNYYTLESIGKMSGFKSKSTFNSRFKEFKGMSPSQYKKQAFLQEKIA